jgi:hypothetical protein
MEPTVKVTSILAKDIDAPSPLYKYRCWDNVFHKAILSLQEIYLAPPSSFEDKREFRNFKRYDLMNDEDIYAKYLQFSKDKNGGFTPEQHNTYAIEWTNRAPFKDPNYLKTAEEEQFKEYDGRIGILSLTEYNDSLAMWNYYSNKGSGFCVGFDTNVLFKFIGGGGKVDYPIAGLPIINGTDSYLVERWKKTFNKEVKWTFEQEYRVSIFNPDGLSNQQRKIKLPIECIKEVIFGWNILPKEKQKIIKVCKTVGLQVRYYQAIKGNDPVTIRQVEA